MIFSKNIKKESIGEEDSAEVLTSINEVITKPDHPGVIDPTTPDDDNKVDAVKPDQIELDHKEDPDKDETHRSSFFMS